MFNDQLARMFFGYDGEAIILLHGYVKAVGKKPSKPDFARAHRFWLDCQQHHRVSPEVEGDNE